MSYKTDKCVEPVPDFKRTSRDLEMREVYATQKKCICRVCDIQFWSDVERDVCSVRCFHERNQD